MSYLRVDRLLWPGSLSMVLSGSGSYWCLVALTADRFGVVFIDLPLHRLGMQMGRIDLLWPWKSALAEDDGDLGMGRTCCNAAEQISGAACSHPHTHTHTHINCSLRTHFSRRQARLLYISNIKQQNVHRCTQININAHARSLFLPG